MTLSCVSEYSVCWLMLGIAFFESGRTCGWNVGDVWRRNEILLKLPFLFFYANVCMKYTTGGSRIWKKTSQLLSIEHILSINQQRNVSSDLQTPVMYFGTIQVKLLESFARSLLRLLILRPLATDSITLVMCLGISVHFELRECLNVFEILEFELWTAPSSRSLFIHMAIADLPGVVASLQQKRLLKAFRCSSETKFWPKFPHIRPSIYSYTCRIVIDL